MLFAERGGVKCVVPDCGAPAFSDKALAENLNDAEFDEYVRAKEKLAESKVARDLEDQFAARLRREVEALRAAGGDSDDALAAELRGHVLERIFSLSCPRCHQVFADFNGCFALYCGRPGCGCGFCAYCLEDCGSDAHQHVPKCKAYGANGDFFGDCAAAPRRSSRTSCGSCRPPGPRASSKTARATSPTSTSAGPGRSPRPSPPLGPRPLSPLPAPPLLPAKP